MEIDKVVPVAASVKTKLGNTDQQKIDSSADSPAGSDLDSEGFECEGTVVALFAFDPFFCSDDRDLGDLLAEVFEHTKILENHSRVAMAV